MHPKGGGGAWQARPPMVFGHMREKYNHDFLYCIVLYSYIPGAAADGLWIHARAAAALGQRRPRRLPGTADELNRYIYYKYEFNKY